MSSSSPIEGFFPERSNNILVLKSEDTLNEMVSAARETDALTRNQILMNAKPAQRKPRNPVGGSELRSLFSDRHTVVLDHSRRAPE